MTLQFNNPTASLAYFEVLVDGAPWNGHTGGAHQVVPDDIQYGGHNVTAGTSQTHTYTGSEVQVRFALGNPGTAFFDWTTFNADPYTDADVIVNANVVAGNSGLTELPADVEIQVLDANGDVVRGADASGQALPLEGIPFDFPGIDGTYTVVLTGIDADTATFTVTDGVVSPESVTLTLVGEEDPDPGMGSVEITKVYCDDLDDVVFGADVDAIGEDCEAGPATFSFYLIGDGTADYTQIEVDESGTDAVDLLAGEYEVVEEGTQAKTTIEVFVNEPTTLVVQNPVPTDDPVTPVPTETVVPTETPGDDVTPAPTETPGEGDNGDTPDDTHKDDTDKPEDKESDAVKTLPSTGQGGSGGGSTGMLLMLSTAAAVAATGGGLLVRQKRS